uniref:Uncharacterized protein n=1 Tax=Panagrolaimus sp. PS1159 TaxID=55785 RepID=A0AC35F9S3_9BILA
MDMKSYIEHRLSASSVQVRLLCCDKVIKTGTCNFRCNKPWMLLLSANSPRELKTFTMDKILQLPLTIAHPEIKETYFFGWCHISCTRTFC